MGTEFARPNAIIYRQPPGSCHSARRGTYVSDPSRAGIDLHLHCWSIGHPCRLLANAGAITGILEASHRPRKDCLAPAILKREVVLPERLLCLRAQRSDECGCPV